MGTQHRNALGRGLSSLISMDDVPARGASLINEIPLSQITANPDQPRRDFDNDSLEELAQSIREIGIIQPVSLRKTGADSYQIIAGERRFRAAKLAGLESVPAYIRTANDAELTEMALVENIQREDLNPIEIALTFKKLIDQYDLTQEKLSGRVGVKRTTIANFLRLLRLPAEVQLGLRDRQVDMGHARALLSVADPALQLQLYNRIVEEGLSVRKVEEYAKAYQRGEIPGKQTAKHAAVKIDNELMAGFSRELSSRFSLPVSFSCNKSGNGKITFKFRNDEELMKLMNMFDSLKQS